MQRFRNILVGLDFQETDGNLSEGSRSAARQALRLAQRTGARVDFLHCLHRDAESGKMLSDEYRDAALRQIAGMLAGAEGVRSSGLTFAEERPWIALTRHVLAGAADLVVIAKRNHSRRDDRKLGSVSIKLIRKCPAPVWVVKPEHEFRHRGVLAATDLTHVGDLATEFGAFVAQADECDLFVAHAWQVPMDLQLSAARIGGEETLRRKKEIASAALEHIRAVPGVAALGKRAHVYLACDSPSHAILQLVAEKNPDLVVMGTVSRGGIAGVLVGNTAEKLLYQLDCSLLTVKPEDFVCPLSVRPPA